MPLCDFYEQNKDSNEEPAVPDDLISDASAFADVAVITFSRISGEEFDRVCEKYDGDYYLSKSEESLVSAVCAKFEKVVVVFNVCGVVDLSWCAENKKISAVLCTWLGGNMGTYVAADILIGKINPSGKLSDTFAADYCDYPSSENFNASEELIEYTEDIFVGYRYFNTIPGADKKIVYQFGYGLSYTDFTIDAEGCRKGDNISVTATVKNVGRYSGKEVIEVYVSSPSQKLCKPKIELRAFAKTPLLSPNHKHTAEIFFKILDMASYDEQSASYVLEKGDYTVYVGNSSVNIKPVFTYHIDNDTVTKKLVNRCTPHKLSKRMISDGSYIDCEISENAAKNDVSNFSDDLYWQNSHKELFSNDVSRPDLRILQSEEGRIQLKQVANGEYSLDEFVSQLNLSELITLCGGYYTGGVERGVAGISGVGDMPYFGIPAAPFTEGPSGIRVSFESTAFP